MNQQATKRGWWELVTLLFAINSLLVGVLIGSQFNWAIPFGYLPGVLLLAGLRIRSDHRAVATGLIVVASVAAAFAYWMVYPVVLAAVVIVGGISTGMIGPDRAQPAVS